MRQIFANLDVYKLLLLKRIIKQIKNDYGRAEWFEGLVRGFVKLKKLKNPIKSGWVGQAPTRIFFFGNVVFFYFFSVVFMFPNVSKKKKIG